jgi:hypothetical protein
MKFVREASQRRSASHTYIHDPDTHGDQSRSSNDTKSDNSAGANVRTVLGTSENHRDEITSRLHEDCEFRNILEINQPLKARIRRNQKVMKKKAPQARRRKHFESPQKGFHSDQPYTGRRRF